MTEPVVPDGVPRVGARLLVYLFLPTAIFLLPLIGIGVMSFLYAVNGSRTAGDETFFWAVAGVVPACGLAATWAPPPRIPRPEGTLFMPQGQVSFSLLETARHWLARIVAGLLALIATLGFVGAVLALTRCAGALCGGATTYRWAMLGLVAALALPPALAISRLALSMTLLPTPESHSAGPAPLNR